MLINVTCNHFVAATKLQVKTDLKKTPQKRLGPISPKKSSKTSECESSWVKLKVNDRKQKTDVTSSLTVDTSTVCVSLK